MFRLSYLLVILFFSDSVSQEFIEGKILFSESGQDYPVMGASIKWISTNKGTISNEQGFFKLERESKTDSIVISYVGFQTDTLLVKNINNITHYMSYSEENFLDEVTVSKRRNSAQRTYLMPQNIINISEEELLKAACCNLSESFETNPSVDVNHNDALTGTKQIEMLGLKSPYILITEENIPMVRGASQTFGLGFTPGTWIESIQVTKGM